MRVVDNLIGPRGTVLTIKKDKHGRFHWSLNRNGSEIARSRVKGYSAKHSAKQSLIGVLNGAEALIDQVQ